MHAARTPEKLDPTLLATMEAGAHYSAVDLHEAQFARTNCFLRYRISCPALTDCVADALVPATPGWISIRSGGSRSPVMTRGRSVARGTLHFPIQSDRPPAISIALRPFGGGLPIGLQLVGRWHEDSDLIDVASQLEASLNFKAHADEVLSTGRGPAGAG